MNSIDMGLGLLEVLQTAGNMLDYHEICKMTDEKKAMYSKLLDDFINVNSSDATNEAKGIALEKLSSYLLKASGDIFSVYRNLRTTTNEIDLLMTLNSKGKILVSYGLINKKFSCFISECKNHKSSITVTYVGKFCSLMLTNQTKIGIMFSYKGISGKDWNYGSGLVKKFYLSKENLDERFCIIDFSKDDFVRVKQGYNFFQIVDEKLNALQFDTDYTHFITKHPAENGAC